MSRRRPGNGSATLLDMLSNLFYFSLFPAGGEQHRERKREKERETVRRRERERRLPKERQSAPSSTYLLPSAHVDAIFQYRVKRALPFSFTHPPTPPLPLATPIFLSFRLASSFFSRGERENGSEARNEKKGRKEPGEWRERVAERRRRRWRTRAARSYG